MSHTITVTLRLERDGVSVLNYPTTAMLTARFIERFRLARTADDQYEPLPEMFDAQLLLLRPEGLVRFRLAGQATSNVPVNTGGVLMIFGASIPGDRDMKVKVEASVQTYVEGLMGSGPPQ